MIAKQIAMRDAYGEALLELAPVIPELVVLDADVSSSTKTAAFGKKYPERFFNVGVAEANMIDIAAGLATCGLRPTVNTFALFIALKGLDQVRNIIAYNNIPVVLMGTYAGLSDSYDGASHQSITDLAIMRSMPNMTVVVPGDAIEVRQALETALHHNGPTFIRIGRNPTPVIFSDMPPLEIGKIRKIKEGTDLTIAVCGVPASMAINAADNLIKEGISVDLIEISTLKPIDSETLVASAKKTGRILTVEEHTIFGGLGSAVAETLSKYYPVKIDMIGIQDRFAESGDYTALLYKYGISAEHIEKRAKLLLDKN
jgi:transketolase